MGKQPRSKLLRSGLAKPLAKTNPVPRENFTTFVLSTTSNEIRFSLTFRNAQGGAL